MKIKELLSDESKWCKGSYAKDDKGNDVSSFDKSACCWCLIGAVRKCYPNSEMFDIMDNIADKIFKLNYKHIATFNDCSETTFEDIRQLVEILDI